MGLFKSRVSFKFDIDTSVVEAGEDGVLKESCWFCGRQIETPIANPATDAASFTIMRMAGGDPIRGVCHVACAERAKASLAF
jgi:hypothetical protein